MVPGTGGTANSARPSKVSETLRDAPGQGGTLYGSLVYP